MLLNKIIPSFIRLNLTQITSRSIYTIQNMVKATIPKSELITQSKIQFPLPNSYLLKPINLIYSQIAGFKVKGQLRRRCKDCFFVMRQQRLYVLCKTHPRHKQMSMKPKDKKSWILTHATQSKIRPY